MVYDLLVCIKGHQHAHLIEDTIDSVRMCSSGDVGIMVSLDGDPTIKGYPFSVPVHVSTRRWGWGAGLFGLFVEALLWAEERFSFHHFLSLDYDAVFIRPGTDQFLLSAITSPEIGVLGHVEYKEGWRRTFQRRRGAFLSILGSVGRYEPGRSVMGAAMLLTRPFLRAFLARDPASLVGPLVDTTVTDDNLISILCGAFGLRLENLPGINVTWRFRENVPPHRASGAIYHPVKMGPKASQELEVRNFFRRRRGRERLLI